MWYIELLAATIGSLAFAMVSGIKPRYYLQAAIGGLLCWGAYLTAMHFTKHIFISTIVASAFCAIYSEIFARVMKAPVILFFTPTIISLVPGSALYYTCSNIVSRDWQAARSYGFLTLQYALAIASGACIIWAVISTIDNIKKQKNNKQNN